MTAINYNLPTIRISDVNEKFPLDAEEVEIINDILYNPVNGVGVLRGTRPKVNGVSAWVWRKLMTLVSQEIKFHSISTSLDSYLDEDYPNDTVEDRANRILWLELLVEKIMVVIPENEQHGANSWKMACDNR